LLVVHNVFFESFHLTLRLNKANGIAESAMILSLDYAFWALKFGKFVFLSRDLSIADFRLRLDKRCSTSRSTNPITFKMLTAVSCLVNSINMELRAEVNGWIPKPPSPF
jgi:hypothetical protein